jgi:hypothetical protein
MALAKSYAFADEKGITVDGTFQLVLLELLSSRPSICVEALVDFPDLQSVAIESVYNAFASYFRSDSSIAEAKEASAPEENDETATITPCHQNQLKDSFTCPFQLIQSICVVLSTCKDVESQVSTTALAVRSLVEALLQPHEGDGNTTQGLAGATINSGKRAVGVDSVSKSASQR